MQKSESDVIFTCNGKSERLDRKSAKRKIQKLRLPPEVEYSIDFVFGKNDFSLRYDDVEIQISPLKPENRHSEIRNLKSEIFRAMPKTGIYAYTNRGR